MAKVRALRVEDGLTYWDFSPSVGIIAAKVDKLGLDIRSFREPLKRSIQQVLAPSFQMNFTSGGRPDAWGELSDYAKKRHAAEGGTGRPLNKSGQLKKVMGQVNIWTINPNSASLQSLPGSVWYGKVHQSGYGNASKGMKLESPEDAQKILDKIMSAGSFKAAAIPQRQFVLIQDEDYDGIEKVFSDWLDERIARTWARG